MVFQFFAAILLGVFGGKKLDDWLGTSPWLLVVLSLFGFAAGMYLVLKDINKQDK